MEPMVDKLHHRGPDSNGYFISRDKRVVLGHTRLSIIDLSAKASQPMCYLNRYYCAFNGEIYNFQKERDALERQGYKFVSSSDTEVLLALYARYGKKCLNRLRGMFAFCIYDDKEKTLFLARDRVGKKPLKYALNDRFIIFASELKAILTQPEVKRIPDYKAIEMYLTYGYVPAPRTGFEGINKLPPGSYLFINLKNGSVESKRYWQPMFDEKLDLSERQWCQEILNTLSEATKLRMVADVPVGAFLSGGVDSSGVVAAMAHLSDKPVKTFTISFEDKTLNEAPYADKIARMYRTEHHELLAKPESVDLLPYLAEQFEEPFSDASSVITYSLSKMAKKYITVVLNGDGGDENFAGYPNRYLRLKRDVDYDYWIKRLRPLAAKSLALFKKIKKSNELVRAEKFFDKAGLPIYSRFASYNRIFSLDEIDSHAKGELRAVKASFNPYETVEECFSLFKGNDLKDAGLKFDLLYFLPDDLLTKMDMATMAVSLEARSPLLDQEMVELACKIPFNLKVRNGVTKYIQKKAFEKIVPKENLYRPKVGFTIPLHKWFGGELNGYATDLLVSKNSRIKNILDTGYVRSMIEDNNKKQDFGPRLWALMSLELWMRAYFFE